MARLQQSSERQVAVSGFRTANHAIDEGASILFGRVRSLEQRCILVRSTGQREVGDGVPDAAHPIFVVVDYEANSIERHSPESFALFARRHGAIWRAIHPADGE